jgi:acyl-CoA synthetase (AMP-forming)/AMP-acid ligase II
MDFIDAFRRTVRCHGNETAIITDEETVTYNEFDDRATRLANALNERIPGERCAVLAHTGLAALDAMVAGDKRGLATVQLPYRAAPAELVEMLDTAEAAGLVFDAANADLARTVLDRTDLDCALQAGGDPIDHPGVEEYDAAIEAASGDRPDAAGNEHAVFYTSGTTSKPKAVLFDQEQMWHGSTQVVMEMSIEETDRALVTTPWYHMVTSDAWMLPHLQAGASLVLQPEFDPGTALERIADHDVTGLLAVPTQLTAMIDAQADAGYDIDTLSYIRTGGSVVTPRLVRRASEHLTEGVYNTYGLTEGGPNLTFAHPTAQDEHTGTIGTESFMWELKTVEAAPPDELPDPEATVEPGETGEILARSPGMADGYLDNPAAEELLFVDGWLRTNDVARVDEGGYLHIVDRVDNMVVSGGENVYPQEVERVFEDHDAVREAVVFGQPDEEWGEVLCTVVSTTGDVTEAELDDFCVDHDGLADFKRPRKYALTDETLPRTDTGTLQRTTAIERFFE